MIVERIQPGTYILAVSGGMDSMVLLDMLRKPPNRRLIVAHVDHGIRENAAEDAQLVRSVAMSHNLVYESVTLSLGKSASEELARMRRYGFLRHLRQKYNAQAIITAHHLDDLIETAIINLLRGTGWRGLSSLRSHGDLVRPLLCLSKHELWQYAKERQLQWNEDSTNSDQSYLRNYVRHSLVPRLTHTQVENLYQNIVRQNELTQSIEHEVARWLETHVDVDSPVMSLPRHHLIMMSSDVAHELLQEVLRRVTGKSAVRPLVNQALLFIKVAKPHKVFPIDAYWQLRVQRARVIVEQRPTVVS